MPKTKMTKFRKKPVVIEAITFEEFVAFAKETTAEPHWSIPYKGVNITQENDERYIIPTLEGNHNFTPEDMLITGVKGEIYPCKKDIFEATYDQVEKKEGLTFEEAEKFLKIGECISLPEWKGFWFQSIKTGKTLVLTVDNIILNTPNEIYKGRLDWKIVTPTDIQEKVLKEYWEEFSKYPTFGEKAVGLQFNPSQLSDVDKVKRAFADIIDKCNDIQCTSYLGNTLKGMAIRACIEAQMAVVKLITFKE